MTSPLQRHHDDQHPAGVLVVVAVPAEAEAVLRGLGHGAAPHAVPGGELRRSLLSTGAPVDVLAGGVGPAAVAAATAAALATFPYRLVVSAGIAGGFAPQAPVGSVVVATELVAADLGAESPEGFLDVEQLGFGRTRYTPPAAAVALAAGDLRAAAVIAPGPGATARPLLTVATGPVLTVSTVTGSAERAAELADRHPGAVAEAMEGHGVAEAAARFGLPALEIRAVSNPVGPRDRSAWRIGEALAALELAFQVLPLPAVLEALPRD
ncbi:futalosine nucleosidase [Kitasatospora sp. MMS16-BH015]|uniref:futalosine hydrolase n=1 Tax=Kitasatospora sp. MMS16-BH015 TaxID=2018025 RepID=UPI000CA1D7B3|nr:futalosine hydrolase [Kitasatospora sp. MMS16-BH015]AUG79152.1 futalosine nucleosidase [Kitasatospora sp. MMS16-BH015]